MIFPGEYMKSSQFFCLFLLFCMMFTLVSCGREGIPENSEQFAVVDDKVESENIAPPPKGYGGGVAYINNEMVVHGEVLKMLRLDSLDLSDDSISSISARKYKKALNFLIESKLILNDANKRGITIPEKVINREMDRFVSQRGGIEKLNEVLSTKGLTVDDIRKKITQDMIVDDYFKAALTPPVISPSDIRNLYNERKNTGVYKTPGGMKIKEIVLKVGQEVKQADGKVKERTFDETKKLAEEIRKRALKEDFHKLAVEVSEGYGKNDPCYTGDYISPESLGEVLEVNLKKLKVGEVSNVLEIKTNKTFFWIIKMLEIKKESSKSLSEVQGEIERYLMQSKRAQLRDKKIKELREKAFIRYVNWE